MQPQYMPSNIYGNPYIKYPIPLINPGVPSLQMPNPVLPITNPNGVPLATAYNIYNPVKEDFYVPPMGGQYQHYGYADASGHMQNPNFGQMYPQQQQSLYDHIW
jgi:hypothetical protein